LFARIPDSATLSPKLKLASVALLYAAHCGDGMPVLARLAHADDISSVIAGAWPPTSDARTVLPKS
jgi:hypothetical protein